jgi:hypothetical protein
MALIAHGIAWGLAVWIHVKECGVGSESGGCDSPTAATMLGWVGLGWLVLVLALTVGWEAVRAAKHLRGGNGRTAL